MSDITEIVPGLWQGREPATAAEVAHFDLVILTWEDGAKNWDRFPASVRPRFHLAAMQDDTRTLRPGDELVAEHAMLSAVDFMAKGRTVLATCMQGMNRSGLVVALTLHRHHGWSMQRCIAHIREKRPGALYNPAFVAYLLDGR